MRRLEAEGRLTLYRPTLRRTLVRVREADAAILATAR
jgi:hypothetical protein